MAAYYQTIFLLCNLALAFYNTGTVWAHEIDTFRNWQLMDKNSFMAVRAAHWHKLSYWVFIPVAVALLGGIVLIWYHPPGSPVWAIWGNVLVQLFTHFLTLVFGGRWQAQLADDHLGPQSPLLHKIVRTHWVRTLLINIYAFQLLAWFIIIMK